MSEYNAKNYTEQGGDVTHIGGKLIIEEDAQIEGLETGSEYTLPAATASELGGVKVGNGLSVAADGTLSIANATTAAAGLVKQAEHQASFSQGSLMDLESALNGLIEKLVAAGIMASE